MMNTFVGMIIGCLLTIGLVYIHDTMATSTVADASKDSQAIVNWDVAAHEWNHVETNVRMAWLKLQNSYNRG